jgi:hypothetical protein
MKGMRKARLLWCLSILLIALLVVSVIAVFLNTQQVDNAGKLRLEWQQVLPGVEGWSIIQTSDGGYLVLGKNSSIVTINGLQEYSGKNDAVLVKTDVNGNILWHRIYPLLGSNSRRIEVIETSDRCYAFGGTLYNDSEPSQCYLTKVDDEGNTLWNRTYAGPTIHTDVESVQLTDFLQLDDGSYIIIGAYKANFYHFGTYYVKVDSSGNLQLNTTLGTVSLGSPGSIMSASDDAFVIRTGFAGRGGSGSYFNLAKIDLNGTVIWKTKYFEENSRSSSGRGGAQTSDGGFMLFARISYGNEYGLWVVKTDSQGNMLWNRTYDEMGSIQSVGQTSDGGIIFGGRAKDGNLTDYGEGKVWIVKVDALGNIEAQIKTGGPVSEQGSNINKILQVSDGGYICVGTMNITLPASPDQTFWIAKFSS